MSIASELNNYRSGLEDAYDAVSDMSGTIPTDRNMNNLDDAIRTIPISSPNDGVLTITQNGTTVQTFSANQATNVTAALTDTTYSDFTGATSSVAGAHGLVPAPSAGDEGKALHGDGTWKDTTAKLVEMAYGESNAWAKFIAAYNAGSIVYCRASSNSNPATGSQTRKAFMAYVNNATSPTSVEFQYVRSVSSKTDSQQCDQVFVYTLTNASGGTWSVATRNMAPKINVSGAITKTFSNGANATVTIGADAMTGATSGAAGAAGVVPAPAAGDQNDVLKGDGTWGTVSAANLSDTGWVLADQYINTTYFAARYHIYYRILGGVVYWKGQVYCHTAPSSSDNTANLLTGLPNSVMSSDQATACGLQYMIPDGEYQMWTENNGIRVWEARQQIPATSDYQGYDLGQFCYLSVDT